MFKYWIAGIAFAVAGARAASLTEDSCSIVASNPGEAPTLREVLGLSVLSLRPDHPLVMSAVDGVKINAIMCWRSQARFAENDYLVTDAGFPLYIKTDFADESQNRTLALERINDSFRIRLLDGPELSAAEKDEAQQFLALYAAKVKDRSRTLADAKPSDVAPLAANAPADQPLSITADQLRAYDRAIEPYVAQARQTWPEAKRRFLAGLPRGHIFFVTIHLTDASNRRETVFIRVQSIAEGVISGLIATDLQFIQGHKLGDAYSFLEDDLIDWTIAKPDGSEEGNVVGKFLDTYRP